MERLDFIRKLFILYGKSTEKSIDLIRDYDLALSEEQNIDWDRMLRLVEKSDLNSLPNPKYLKSLFPKCKIEIEGQYKYKGGNAVLTLKRENKPNLFYVFPMDFAEHTIEEYYNKYRQKYGYSFLDFKYYPPNFEIIGRKIYDTSTEPMQLYEVI